MTKIGTGPETTSPDTFASSPVFAESMAPVGEVFEAPADTMDPDVARRRARVAAVADLRNAENSQFFDHYAKMLDTYDRMYAAGQGEAVASSQLKQRLLDGVSAVTLASEEGRFEASSAILADLFAYRAQSDSVGAGASEALQDLYGTTDLDQIAMYESGLNAFDFRTEYDRRIAKIQELVEDIEFEKDQRHMLFDVVDFALELVPFLDSTARTGNVDTDDVVKRWHDSVFAGQRQSSESIALWLMSPEEFDAYVESDLPARLQKSVTELGYRSLSRELNIASSFNSGVNETMINSMNLLDNGPLLMWGATKAARLGRGGVAGMLEGAGASTESAEFLARMSKIAEEQGEAALEKQFGESVENIADTVLPKSVNPTKERVNSALTDGGLEAARRYEMGKAINQEVLGEIETLKRLQPEEQKAAVETIVERQSKAYGKERVIGHEVINRTSVSGVDSPVVRLQFGTAKGGRFANENTARRFGRNNGLAATRVVGDGPKTSPKRPSLKDVDNDPVILKARQKSADPLTVNPTGPQLKGMFLMSASDEIPGVKGFVTGDGNTIFWRAADETHAEAATRLGLSLDEVGRLHYAPGNEKNAGFYNPKQKGNNQSALGANDQPFRTFDKRPQTAVDSDALKVVDELRGKEASLVREIEDLKASIMKQSLNTSGDMINRMRRQQGAAEKELRQTRRAVRAAEVELSKEPAQAVLKEEPGRGYYIEAEFPLVDTGFYTPVTDVPDAIRAGGIGRWILGGRQLASEDVFGLAVQSVARRNALLRILNKTLAPPFKALNSTERGILNNVIAKGEEVGEWYDSDQLRVMFHENFQMGYDALRADRFIEAYNAYKYANDLEYALRNDEMFSLKNAQGFQTIEIDIADFTIPATNGRVIRDLPENLPASRVYNAHEKFSYVGPSAERYNAKALQDEGYVMVELDVPMVRDVPNGQIQFNRVLVKANDVDVSPLRNAQINYRAGGHRMYDPSVKWFIKQAKVFRQADTGETFLTRPTTWKGGRTKGELAEWVNLHNQGLIIGKAVKEGTLDPDAARVQLNDIVDDADDFLNDILDGRIDVDNPFEVVFDRELPSQYAASTQAVGENVIEDSLPGFMSHAQTMGRMYYSPKGNVLTDPTGAKLPTISGYDAANRALGNVAQLVGFSSYKRRTIQKWLSTYGKYLDARGVTNENRIFLESTFRKGTPDNIQLAASQERDVIRRTLNWTTPAEMRGRTMVRQLITALEEGDTFLGKTVGKRVGSTINWMDENDFFGKLRGAVFDAKLGLFNVAQFPMQITTMYAAISIDPQNGMVAMNNLLPLRTFSMGRWNDVDSFRLWAGDRKFGFDSQEDFIEMATELRNGGFLDVNRSQVLINDLNTSNAFNLTGSRVHDFREIGRSAFYEAERWNRTVAFQIAWKRARAKGITDKSQFLEEVYKIAEDFSFNMSEASSAAWQKGILSIPTQFWAYQQRMLEMAFGRQLTVPEKMRLVSGQFIMYGSVGIPGLAYVSEKFQGERGEAFSFDKEPLMTALDRGLFDTILKVTTGNDLAFSERAGIGHFHTDLVREFFNVGRYGDSSTYSVLTGATGSVLFDVADDTAKFIDLLAVEAGHGRFPAPIVGQHLNNIARNVSTYNNAFKAYMLWKYESVVSTNNNVIMTDGTQGDALAQFMGIPLGESKELSARMMWLKDRSKTVDDVSRTIAQYRTRFANEIGNSDDVITEYKLFQQMVPEDIWFDANRKASQYTPESTYDSIGRTLTKKKFLEETANDG